MRAAESTLAQYSPPVLSSSGRSSVYTKPLVSTDTISKGKNPDIHKNQQLAEESITSNLSSQPDTPCTPAAVLKIDVSIFLYQMCLDVIEIMHETCPSQTYFIIKTTVFLNKQCLFRHDNLH